MGKKNVETIQSPDSWIFPLLIAFRENVMFFVTSRRADIFLWSLYVVGRCLWPNESS